MPMFDVECNQCKKMDVEYVKIDDIAEYDKNPRICECEGKGQYIRVFRKAPGGAVKLGGESDYHRDVSNTRRRCQEHFVKSGEMDQCRHKFGKTFDDALVSAAAKRIQEGGE